MSADALRSPVRLWPAWIIVALQAGTIAYSLRAEFDNFTRFVAMMAGPLLCLILFLVYWFAFAAVPRRPRLALPALSLLAAVAVTCLADHSTRAALWIYGIPAMLAVTTVGLAVSQAWPWPRRSWWLAGLMLAAWLPFLALRLDGFDGSYFPEFAWRWSPTAEELFAAKPAATSATAGAENPVIASTTSPDDWPGFRGPHRDSRVSGVEIRGDWSKNPPQQVWRIAVGPGWGSFCVIGEAVFTQEQRADQEAVVCYSAVTGQERWSHTDTARFQEIVAGPGPRATPSFADGRLYTQGAMGHLNCLDAATGQLVWSHDLRQELDARLPEWGFSDSPLVVGGVVIVFADGKDDQGLVAYRADTGELAWSIPGPGMNFSSAQAMTLGEQKCVVFATGHDLLAIEPATGQILLRYAPPGWKSAPMVQPQQLDAETLLVALGDGVGTARLRITTSETWNSKVLWSSRNLKPAFNDFVYHQGALYGFDQNIFTCVDAESGQRRWKKGRYGFGQVILFEKQGLLIVLAETGELVLLACDPQEHRELGRFPALEGKTWNHPAFSRGKLYVRNGSEAVCLDLSP